MNQDEMFRIIEGMLFVSNEPVPIKGIATALELSINEVEPVMEELMKRYEEDESRGIKIVRFDDKFQLVTKQNIFGYLTKANSELEKPRISPAMLETLAIIAYKQPITKIEIEGIRGVKSDYIVNKLIEYELIKEVGRADKIGRPLLFGTTDKFLIYFGLENLESLPMVEEQRKITNDNIDEELIRLKEQSEKEPSEDLNMALEAATELAKEWKENPPKKDDVVDEEKNDEENSNVTDEVKDEVTEEAKEEKEEKKEANESSEETENSDDEKEEEKEEEKEFDVDNIDWDSYTEEDDEDEYDDIIWDDEEDDDDEDDEEDEDDNE